MKQVLLILAITLLSCSGGAGSKTANSGATVLTFNSCAMLLPIDTVLHRIPDKPVLQTDDQLDYHNVMVEGIYWDEVVYYFGEGQLLRATAIQHTPDAAGYKKLYQRLTEQYGKPTRDIDSLTIWTRRDAELSLQPGLLLFARR